MIPSNRSNYVFKDAYIVRHFVNKRFLLAWTLGIPCSYLATAFLENFYSSVLGILLVSLVIHSIITLSVSFVLGRIVGKFQSGPTDMALSLTLAVTLAAFLTLLVNMALRFPSLFYAFMYQLKPEMLIYFLIGLVTAIPASLRVSSIIQKENFQQSRIVSFVQANLGGLLLASLFFLIYFLLASIFNQPTFKFDDLFFDTDSRLWRWRFAMENYRDYYERPVHPFVLIIIRPLVAVISLIFNGDSLYATFALVALTGALCVFLVWYFVKKTSGNSLYALLIASLFGASTTQLAFASIIETYIFLAAVALIFIVFLLKDRPLYALVITGLAAFGITVSNFAQTVIAHILIKRDIKQWIKYGLIVAALVVPLNLLNNFVYPDAHPYFWDQTSLGWEAKNVFPVTYQRVNYLARVMFLHSFVAPEPLLLKEDVPFIRVWMFRASIKKAPMQIAQYETWFESAMAFAWLAFMLLGGMLFLKNIRKRDNRFAFTFILTVMFYFVLHVQYGKDVFLYSTNWTYAIMLFLALAWQEFSGKRWFQTALLAFIALLLVNNSRLILFMLTASYIHVR